MSTKKPMPLSPHIGIYKPQISSVLSILHRASGVANFFGMLFFLWWVVFLAFATVPYNDTFIYVFFESIFGKAVLFGWTFSLYLHMCGGIRHLFWDMGYGFGVQKMTLTGYISLGAAITLTVITWFIYYMVVS